MSRKRKIMSQQKIEKQRDKSRKVCRDKDFNVAINSSASGKDQGMKYVMTFSKSVTTWSSDLVVKDNKIMLRHIKYMLL